MGGRVRAACAQLVVLGAPSAIGLSPYPGDGPRGVDLAPATLREQGLVERIGGRDGGDVAAPAEYVDLERPVGRCRNEDDLVAYARELADRVAACVRAREFVLLLGGDCSVLGGALLGARSAGHEPLGLVYLDAHADFATLDESPSGSACSMNLALAAGRAGGPLAHLAGDSPLVRGEHVAHIGRRDDAEPEYGHAALGAWSVLDLSMPTLARHGVGGVVARALERVTAGTAGFWVHFDVDVLDPGVMPAVDSPIPGGLDRDQAVDLLVPLVRHPAALGLQVTLYDPNLDSRRSAARQLVDILERVLADKFSAAAPFI